ncbi:hypothetical protein PB2503_06192 [Parvularcula bermudensis HTCC2503]|uniref:Uncharacterized protein n=1 Tax=Parvularcula bermudensis (strain ATCC BAA-594 / HTCC2503 / KCTC 12087) TaxID=314260 RepID=E0THK8_PARBH|nr:hypothetical protein [Parvularcula bermudensis]ADM09304.1 hypothetical protein PB2503_06192 [Parvularcula bermudensis HTCC2503]
MTRITGSKQAIWVGVAAMIAAILPGCGGYIFGYIVDSYLPQKSPGWDMSGRPQQAALTDADWGSGDLGVGVLAGDIDPPDRFAPGPGLVLSITDQVGGTRLDLSQVQLVEPCSLPLGEGSTAVVVTDRNVQVYEGGDPPMRKVEVSADRPYTTKKGDIVMANIHLDRFSGLKSCTLRLGEAIQPANGERIPDLSFIRGTYKRYSRSFDIPGLLN